MENSDTHAGNTYKWKEIEILIKSKYPTQVYKQYFMEAFRYTSFPALSDYLFLTKRPASVTPHGILI